MTRTLPAILPEPQLDGPLETQLDGPCTPGPGWLTIAGWSPLGRTAAPAAAVAVLAAGRRTDSCCRRTSRSRTPPPGGGCTGHASGGCPPRTSGGACRGPGRGCGPRPGPPGSPCGPSRHPPSCTGSGAGRSRSDRRTGGTARAGPANIRGSTATSAAPAGRFRLIVTAVIPSATGRPPWPTSTGSRGLGGEDCNTAAWAAAGGRRQWVRLGQCDLRLATIQEGGHLPVDQGLVEQADTRG
jgi:hypothetical protein